MQIGVNLFKLELEKKNWSIRNVLRHSNQITHQYDCDPKEANKESILNFIEESKKKNLVKNVCFIEIGSRNLCLVVDLTEAVFRFEL